MNGSKKCIMKESKSIPVFEIVFVTIFCVLNNALRNTCRFAGHSVHVGELKIVSYFRKILSNNKCTHCAQSDVIIFNGVYIFMRVFLFLYFLH